MRHVATWDDVREAALPLPGARESQTYGVPSWKVRDRLFVWERPLRRKELDELGDAAPGGPVLGVRVADVGAKEALLASEPGVFFTTSHFDGYPAVLVRLDAIDADELRELVVEAWADRAPRRLVAEHLGQA